ncbi:hypothetical protein Vwe01_55050 [Micromonospora andamanensis]|nr:hypothetical protein Vwe01_55050 [Micromonospora andamanensis]
MRRQVVTGLLISGMVVTGLGAPAAAGSSPLQQQAKPAVEVPAPPGSAVRATQEARRSGQPVEVSAQRDEFGDVHANPDGSFSAKLHLEPVRVRRGGEWTAVDTTLKAASDGRVMPAAASVDVSFSGGGEGPVVRLADGSAQLALTWPTPLPAPTLVADTATYTDVLPGVDLRLKATSRGFSKVFVVKNRAAARDPRVARLAFGLTAKGTKIQADEHGNVAANDTTGKPLFSMGAPLVWDSSGPQPRRALGRVTHGNGRLAITPDPGLLTDERTRFPVYVDPDVSVGRTGWALVTTAKATQSYWNGDGDNIAKVGPCPISYDSTCRDVGTAMSYFQFNASALAGKEILGAEFNVFGRYSPRCDAPREVEAWGTNPVSSATTWNNQPYWLSSKVRLGAHVASFYGTSSSCNPRWLGFGAKAAVTKGLDSHGGTVAIALRATGTDEYSWKKFDTNPTLVVSYNSRPNVPSALSVEGKGCKQSPNEPHVNPRIDNDPLKGPRGPRLTATGSDPDAGSVQVEFEWANYSGTRIGGATTVMKSSGSTFTADVASAAAADGAKLAVRARAKDSSLISNWTSPWCHVVIDRTAPNTPTVTSTTYRECDGPDCQASGGVGQTGAFTLTPAAGDSDVAGYRYHLHDQAPTYVQAGADGKAVAQITPNDDMSTDLYVRAVDRAGNVSPPRIYHFFVGAGTPPTGHWRLQGHTETAARDDSGGGRHGTVTLGPATWREGRHGTGLWMNGTLDASVTTSGTAPIDTSKTFAVAAWVRLDRLGGFPAAVSLDGGATAAFQLQATPEGEWAFAMPSANVNGGGTSHYRVRSDRPARTGAWTHLVAVHDAAAMRQLLYVNGRLAGSLTRTIPAWRAEGPLTLGRSQWNSARVDPWPGTLDDVRVYDRLLAPEEVRDLANLPAVAQAHFPLDDRLGATSVDVAGRHHVGTFGPGTSQVTGRVGAGAVDFDGSGSGALTTTGQVVRTDSSFTVAAWVKPDVDSYSTTRTVVSQHGEFASGLNLQYRPDKGWSFMLFHKDEHNAARTIASTPASQGQSNWLHLAGVYDAAAQQIRLYKDGELVATEPYTLPAWHANGPMEIGRAKYNGGVKDPWKGAIDNVQVWSGALTGDQIRAEFTDPASVKQTPHGGQLSRYWSPAGHHVVTTRPVAADHRFEWSLGTLTPAGTEGTRTLYSCRAHVNYFLSLMEDCEGYTRLGALGGLYATVPDGIPTVPVHRCKQSPTGTHFASRSSTCEGRVYEGFLGHALAYGNLVGSQRPSTPPDRAAAAHGLPADYRPQQKLGLVSLNGGAGTVPLMTCRSGEDTFSSTDPACEGATVVTQSASLWHPETPPQGVTELGGLFRCRTTAGDVFEADNPGCDGEDFVAFLGYTIASL